MSANHARNVVRNKPEAKEARERTSVSERPRCLERERV